MFEVVIELSVNRAPVRKHVSLPGIPVIEDLVSVWAHDGTASLRLAVEGRNWCTKLQLPVLECRIIGAVDAAEIPAFGFR